MKSIKNSIFILSFSNFMLRAFLQGLIPLYAFLMAKLGAASSEVGIFLSVSYVAIITGTYLAGELIPKYINPKKFFIISYIPVAFAIAAYGFSATLWQFELAGVVGSFFVGTGICSNNILMSYYSTTESLGKNFSFLASSSLMATVAGGFIVGPLISKIGSYWAFTIFGTTLLLCTIFLFFLEMPNFKKEHTSNFKFKISKKFALLLLAIFFTGLLLYGGKSIKVAPVPPQ